MPSPALSPVPTQESPSCLRVKLEQKLQIATWFVPSCSWGGEETGICCPACVRGMLSTENWAMDELLLFWTHLQCSKAPCLSQWQESCHLLLADHTVPVLWGEVSKARFKKQSKLGQKKNNEQGCQNPARTTLWHCQHILNQEKLKIS